MEDCSLVRSFFGSSQKHGDSIFGNFELFSFTKPWVILKRRQLWPSRVTASIRQHEVTDWLSGCCGHWPPKPGYTFLGKTLSFITGKRKITPISPDEWVFHCHTRWNMFKLFSNSETFNCINVRYFTLKNKNKLSSIFYKNKYFQILIIVISKLQLRP